MFPPLAALRAVFAIPASRYTLVALLASVPAFALSTLLEPLLKDFLLFLAHLSTAVLLYRGLTLHQRANALDYSLAICSALLAGQQAGWPFFLYFTLALVAHQQARRTQRPLATAPEVPHARS